MEEVDDDGTCRVEEVSDSCGASQCPVCELCGTLESLRLCARCKDAWYCSKEHQVSHWSKHKSRCKSMQKKTERPENVNGSEGSASSGTTTTGEVQQQQCVSSGLSSQDNIALRQGYHLDHPVDPSGIERTLTELDRTACRTAPPDFSVPPAVPVATGQAWHEAANCTKSNSSAKPTQVVQDSAMTLTGERGKKAEGGRAGRRSQGRRSGKQKHHTHKQKQKTESEKSEPEVEESVENPTTELADYVVKMLNEYGICVMDNFMGETKGTHILQDVCRLHESGAFQDGQVVSQSQGQTKIRGDQITWVERGEPGMENISLLIARLDNIVMACNGKLKNCNIHGRTKAMVACYPGHGTYYMKHVDNPNEDGRVVTCIYYLNKDWVKEHGGILEIFPTRINWVAAIEPKFDRVLFFWSDRRNPHRVQESYFTRFAITVWYFDAAEREKAKHRFQSTGERQGDDRTMSTQLGGGGSSSVTETDDPQYADNGCLKNA